MSQPNAPAALLDADAAIDRLMRYLAIEGVTGHEKAIGAAIAADLEALGVPKAAIRFDTAHERIALPTETGNLIVDIAGTRPGKRILFSTHMDTVPLCAGAKPKREGERIVSDGTTALGGDNRTGCALMVSLVETLIRHKLPHPPITLLFTVREESGLHGARELHAADLLGAEMGFNVDGRLANELIIGAVGQENWRAEIHGRASHAGVAPEKGISATLVGAIALAEAHKAGWFGKVVKKDGHGTSNVGIFGGKPGQPAGDATNVVTDLAVLVGEARSPEAAFAAAITEGFRTAFATAREAVKASDGTMAEVAFTHTPSYPPFRLAEDGPVVSHAKRAVESLGMEPVLVFSNGGLDANWIAGKHGVPSVTIGAGQYEIHTIKEYVDLPEYVRGCRLGVALATL